MTVTNNRICKTTYRPWFVGSAVSAIIVLLVELLWGWSAIAQGKEWTTPTIVSLDPGSSTTRFAWFPDMAVDSLGYPHIVWCLTIPVDDRGLLEQVGYTHWNGIEWEKPNDIVPASPDIVRNAIAADNVGNLHLISAGSVHDQNFTLYYQQAPSDGAWSASAWSRPIQISHQQVYMADLAVDAKGWIHVIYDGRAGSGVDGETPLADVFYRRSTDGGREWSAPVNLYADPEMDASRPYMKVDGGGTVHVTWRNAASGSDSGRGLYYGVYVFSSDGGATWAPPTIIAYPESQIAQPTVGSNGQGGVLLVWRAISRSELFYMWSTDGGRSWGTPFTIPAMYARPWDTPFDMYDMAADSRGRIHLLAVGRDSVREDVPLGVYHVVWDGGEWSTPERIFIGSGLLPEYPKIVIHKGDEIHAAWFTREDTVWDDYAPREIWYSSNGYSLSARPTVIATSTRFAPPVSSPQASWTATMLPTVSVEDGGLPRGLYTESDDVSRLAWALGPVILLILMVIGLRLGWFGRRR